jgi:hypothetical protein
MVLENKIAKMLRKLGKVYTFKVAGTPTTTDTFYQNNSATYTTVSLRAVVLPARAYDIHSNVLHIERPFGVDHVGIIEVLVDQDECPVEEEDYIQVESEWYKLKSRETFGEAYYVFEGRLEAEPV